MRIYTSGPREHCYCCGDFVALAGVGTVCFTPYGTILDMEPPEPRYICGHCWLGKPPKSKEWFRRNTWGRPEKFDGKNWIAA